jgi:hypothetical protein
MGLLDKSKNLDSTDESKVSTLVPPKAEPKVAKAVQVAKPAKAAKPARAKRAKGPRPKGLPDEFELAGKVPRYICWFVNFTVNFGLIIGTLPLLMYDSGGGGTGITTYMLIGAIVAIILNAFVLPVWAGRNVGQFVSRTKFVNSSGRTPLFIHGLMNSSLGLLSLMGIFVVFTKFQDVQDDKGALVWFIIGSLFIILWISNWSIKRNHEMNQGLFDLLFSSYLITHTPTGSETGWLARLEGLGDFGDKYEKRMEAREEKAAEKEAKAISDAEDAKKAAESGEKPAAKAEKKTAAKAAKKSTDKDAKK